MNSQEISEVEATKFCGIIIDNRFNWRHAIESLYKKVNKNIGISLLDEYLQNLPLYHYIIHLYIHSSFTVFMYGDPHMKRTYEKNKILQKKVTRIISGVPPRSHTDGGRYF